MNLTFNNSIIICYNKHYELNLWLQGSVHNCEWEIKNAYEGKDKMW